MRKYSVLLQYPDDEGTFYSWVTAFSSVHAVRRAQIDMYLGWFEYGVEDPDYEPLDNFEDAASLLVIKGYHYGLPCYNT